MYISWHAIVSELCKNSRPTNQTNNRINIYYCSKVTDLCLYTNAVVHEFNFNMHRCAMIVYMCTNYYTVIFSY